MSEDTKDREAPVKLRSYVVVVPDIGDKIDYAEGLLRAIRDAVPEAIVQEAKDLPQRRRRS